MQAGKSRVFYARSPRRPGSLSGIRVPPPPPRADGCTAGRAPGRRDVQRSSPVPARSGRSPARPAAPRAAGPWRLTDATATTRIPVRAAPPPVTPASIPSVIPVLPWPAAAGPPARLRDSRNVPQAKSSRSVPMPAPPKSWRARPERRQAAYPWHLRLVTYHRGYLICAAITLRA